MKYILVTISIIIVSGVLLYYSADTLPPVENGNVIAQNLAVILGETLIVLGALFALVHMVVDLVVTKSVKIHDAVRRGLLFGGMIVGVLAMIAYDIVSWLLVGLWLVSLVIIEVIVIELRR